MRFQFSFRDFGAGALLGLALGTAGISAASFGYEGWNKFSQDFRSGYVTGFLSMANLARNLDPGGWVDSKYPMVPNAKPIEWAAKVDELYKDPENQHYSMNSILQQAAHELQKKYGKAMSPDKRAIERMQQQLAAVKRRREAMGLDPSMRPKKDPTQVEAAPKTAQPPAPKPPRKWCRCDGKNPKAERAKRRAAAAEKAKAANTTKSDVDKAAAGAAPAATPAPAPSGATKKPETPAKH
jgi:hypothetical protein